MTTAPGQHSALDARDDMLAVADTWPDLLDRLGREDSSTPDGMPKQVNRTPGLVINEAVSDAMRQLAAWAHFLARVLMEETDWTPPPGADTPRLLTLIARQRIGHFTAHTDQSIRLAFHDDARAMRELAERNAYPSMRKWVRVHVACLEYATTDAGERTPCLGGYRVLLDPEAYGLIPDMVCERDITHRISPVDWQRAARKSGYDPARVREILAMTRGDVG